jgi:cysteine desulfurase/selenocysteine lyase
MPIDVEQARADTPGCDQVVHLNNAGASLPPHVVLDTQLEWLQTEAVTGGYEIDAERVQVLDATYDEVAALVGASPDEIALVENATFAWHQAFWSLPIEPGQLILTANVEYATGYISMLQAQRRRGAEIVVIPDDEHGQVSVDAMAELLHRHGQRVALVAITHVPTNGGLVNPAEDVGRLTREAEVPYLLDACQSVGQMPVDVEAIGCDMLSATGRKFLRAPRGTGFLYVRRGVLERMAPAFLDLLGAEWTAPDQFQMRADARRFENWESSHAGQAGLAAAVRYARTWGLEAIGARIDELADYVRAALAGVPRVTLHDQGLRTCGIVTFSHAAHAAEAVKDAMRGRGVNVSVSDPSSTLLDARRRALPSLVRVSPHYYNTTDELDCLVAALQELGR